MAVLTAKGIANLSIELLTRQLILPRTVTMVSGSEFMGPNGGTVTVRVPQPTTARTQASPGAALTADAMSEIPVDVSLSHVYHLTNLTDQDLTYTLEDFGAQITKPQVDAVAAGAEQKLYDVINALTVQSAVTYEFDISPTAPATDDTETRRVLLLARKYLSDANCPATDRWLACGSTIYNRVIQLLTPTAVAVDSGSDALRNAIAGRIYGFNVIEAPGLDTAEAVAYHKSAFAFAFRSPALPKGASESALVNAQGVSLRQVFQYNAATATDQSLVSTFAGAAAIYEDGTGTDGTIRSRFCKLQNSAT